MDLFPEGLGDLVLVLFVQSQNKINNVQSRVPALILFLSFRSNMSPKQLTLFGAGRRQHVQSAAGFAVLFIVLVVVRF